MALFDFGIINRAEFAYITRGGKRPFFHPYHAQNHPTASPPNNQSEKQTESFIEQFMRLSSSVEVVQQSTIVPDLLMFAASEDTAVSIENERRRLAQKLQAQISDSLNLLLSQTQLYEGSAAADPTARMAFSVLATLVRQVVQQVNDLEADLYPEVLDNLGLEPALEALVSREMRTYGTDTDCGRHDQQRNCAKVEHQSTHGELSFRQYLFKIGRELPHGSGRFCPAFRHRKTTTCLNKQVKAVQTAVLPNQTNMLQSKHKNLVTRRL